MVTVKSQEADQPVDAGQQDADAVEFPLDHLAKLDDQLNRPKWVVPVRPDDDLERLLRAAIKLCREGEYMYFQCFLLTHTRVCGAFVGLW